MKAQHKEPVFANQDFLNAIFNSNFEAVKDLVINHGADVNALDNFRGPVLACAIYSQNDQIIDFLLKQGALVNPEYKHVEITPLGAACQVAARADKPENINFIFSKLIDLGADLNPKNCFSSPLTEVIKTNGPCSGVMATHLVQNYKAEINPTLDNAKTPLAAATQIAASKGVFDLFFQCLSLGAEINPINPNQTSPLVAAIESSGLYAKAIASFLIENGAKVEISDEPIYSSPLHQAARLGQKEIYELLVSKGANVNHKINGISSFEQAFSAHNFEMAEYIFTNFTKDIHITKEIFKSCMIFQQSKLLDLFIAQGFDYTNECARTIKHSDSKIIQAIINKYNEYPPIEHPQFKFGEFVLRALDPQYSNESDTPDNTANKKIDSKLSIKDGLLYDKNDILFSTPLLETDANKYIWVLDRHGELFSCPRRGEISNSEIGNHHSFFSKKDGFGKPIACGGYFKVKEGKIIEIDSHSGHYKPTKDQLILAVKFLYKEGVFTENVNIQYSNGELKKITLQEVLAIDSESILSNYPTLEGYELSKCQIVGNPDFDFNNLDINSIDIQTTSTGEILDQYSDLL